MSDGRDRQADQDNASNNGYGIKRRDVLLSGASMFAASALIGEASIITASKPANAQAIVATSTALSLRARAGQCRSYPAGARYYTAKTQGRLGIDRIRQRAVDAMLTWTRNSPALNRLSLTAIPPTTSIPATNRLGTK